MAKVNDRVENINDELDFEPTLGEDEDFGIEVAREETSFEDDGQMSVTPATKNLPSTSVGDGLDFNFGDLGDMPGVVVGDIGLEVSRLPVERCKFTKDSRALISIVTSKVIAVKVHYREGLGSYLCFGGKCCDMDGLSRVKYLFPVIVYDTDKKGIPVSNKVEYKCLAIGKDSYEDIMAMQELNGDITNMDLLVVCKDEQYQKVSFQQAGPARWKKSKRLVKETQDFWREHMKDIIKPVARKITEAELMKDASADIAPSQGEVNFDDVFGDE